MAHPHGTLQKPDAQLDSALEFMGLRARRHHAYQSLPKPTNAPVVVLKRQHEEITVYVSQPEYDHPTSTVALQKYGQPAYGTRALERRNHRSDRLKELRVYSNYQS